MEQNTFRCPFEIKGEAAGTILTIELKREHGARMIQYKEAFKAFYANLDILALRFVPPEADFADCMSLEELRTKVRPYQCELLGAEIDVRLYPFLPYQPYKSVSIAEGLNRIYMLVASSVFEAMYEMKGIGPRSASDIALWIEQRFEEGARSGMPQVQIVLRDPKAELMLPMMRIAPGLLMIDFERMIDSDDPSINKNLFGIVRSPLYPKSIGRYSKRTELVFTREADFARLTPQARRKIRTESNAMLQSEGIRVVNLHEDKQNSGVWVPEFKSKK